MTLLNTADAVYVGDISADKVYLGDTLVWSSSPWDSDTQKYLDATGLDEQYAPALDGLVKGLKDKGLWVKMSAIYPFIGGTEDLHKWNLMDPRDADDAFRLTFVGGLHSGELGYRANAQGTQIGSPNHADTHFVPLNHMTQDSTHLAFYSLEDTPPADRAEIGCYNWAGPASRFHIIARYLGVNSFYYGMSENGGDSNVSVSSADGLFVATRTGPTAQAGYHKGVVAGSNAAPSVPLPPVPIWIGGINTFANKSDIPCGFVSIGAGLDAQNVADLNSVVQEYRLAVSGATWTPALIPGLALWLDPSQDLFADGEKVLSYQEYSPYGRTLVTDDVNGPIFRAGGAPYLDFTVTHVGFRADDVNLGLDGLTHIFVCDGYGFDYPMMLVHHTDTDGIEMRFNASGTENVVRYGTNGIVFSNMEPSVAGRWNIHVQRLTYGVGTESIVNDVSMVDGRLPTALNIPTTQYVARRQGGYYYSGKMAEALVFEGPISNENLALLTDYLKSKHGL